MVTQPSERVGERTTTLLEFAAETTLEDIPEEVRSHARLVTLDTVTSLLSASDPRFDPGQTLTTFADEAGGSPHASIVGSGFRTSCATAALANGTMGYFCDLDAHHPEAITHTPAIVVPASLAIGERVDATGREFLEAVIVGIEVACRVSLALNPHALYERGLHPTPISGVFGAAVAGGRLLDLDTEGLATALGLAQTQASGLLAWKAEPTESLRPFNPGIAARNGVTAAQLAALDFASPVDPFEAEYDAFRAFSSGEEEPERLTRGLGDEFAITEHAFKRFSSVAFSHPGLDALVEIQEENDLQAEALEAIEVRFPATGAELIDGDDLKSHSLPYLLAVAANEGTVRIEHIVEDRRDDPAVSDLLERITVVRDEELDPLFPERYTTVVTVETADESFTRRVDHARGTVSNPFDRQDIEAKFERLLEPTVSDERRADIRSLVDTVDEVDSVRDLGDLLRPQPGEYA